jgi:hypothetical protein
MVMIFFYIFYLFILLLLLFFFSKFIFSTLHTNLELSQKLDLLFLQKEEHLRQIHLLQDQLAIILTNSQKKRYWMLH